jgi:hypothetical protein
MELGRDARKRGIQLSAEAIDDRDDRNGNPGGEADIQKASLTTC